MNNPPVNGSYTTVGSIVNLGGYKWPTLPSEMPAGYTRREIPKEEKPPVTTESLLKMYDLLTMFNTPDWGKYTMMLIENIQKLEARVADLENKVNV